MRYCTECGKQIDDTYSFCPYCGAIIRDSGASGSSTDVPPGGPGNVPPQYTQDGKGSHPVAFGKAFWAAFLLGIAMGFLLGIWGILFFPFVFIGGDGHPSNAASALVGASLGWLVGMAIDFVFALSAFGYLD